MMTLSWSRCCVNLWVCPLCDDVIRIIFSTDVFTRFVASTLHRDFISYLDRTVTELHKRDVIHRRALSVSRHQRAPSLDGSRTLSPIATAGAIEMVQAPTYCSHMNTKLFYALVTLYAQLIHLLCLLLQKHVTLYFTS